MLACCLLTLTSKHRLRAKTQQTLTYYESNPTSKAHATQRRVACLCWRANVVSANKQTTP